MRYSVRSLARPLLENADKKLIKSKGEVNRLKILVCVKQVPDTTEIKIDPVTNTLIRNGVPSIVNPFDKNALEAALQLKDKYGAEVTVLSMGPGQAAEALRECYAMGADNMVLVSDRAFGGADTLATSYTLSAAIRALGEFDLILCGKQTTDGDTAQVGSEVSEWLNIPSVSNVKKISKVESDAITIEMDLPEELEIAKVQYPCLLSVDKDIFQPRLPSYVKKMDTADREIEVYSLDDMEDKDETHYGLNGSPTQVKRIFPPTANDHHEVWDGDGSEVADKLFHMITDMKFI